MVTGHFVPRSFRIQSHFVPFWSFRTHFLVISYPVTSISLDQLANLHSVILRYLVPLPCGGATEYRWRYSINHFVPRSFRTYFGHFVSKLGTKLLLKVNSYPSHFVPSFVISYLFFRKKFCLFCTKFGHFAPSSTGCENTC